MIQQPLILTGIERAVEAVGGQTALAQLLKSRSPNKQTISQQAISQWVSRGYAPLERVVEIAELTGVPAVDLAPPSVRSVAAHGR